MIHPLFSNILVKPIKENEQTKSGIVLPDVAQKEKPQIGEIVSVGNGFKSDDGRESVMFLKPGFKVMYKKWGGETISYEGDEYVIIEQREILAILDK